MVNVFISEEKAVYNINLDSVINQYLEEIAHKYNVPFYQVDAACSMFMNMLVKIKMLKYHHVKLKYQQLNA